MNQLSSGKYKHVVIETYDDETYKIAPGEGEKLMSYLVNDPGRFIKITTIDNCVQLLNVSSIKAVKPVERGLEDMTPEERERYWAEHEDTGETPLRPSEIRGLL